MISKVRMPVFLALLVISQPIAAAAAPPSCQQGEAALEKSQFSNVVTTMSECLNAVMLDGAARRRALQVRAWAHFNLRHNKAAVRDQEASFKITGPTEHGEFLNYSSYLRRVARYEDSLTALRAAEAIDKRSGKTGMMTQYNLGWTLTQLGRYDEAVQVLTNAIPLQPEFPFVYWRRALALEGLGRFAEAKQDIDSAARMWTTGPMKFQEDEFTLALRDKIKHYKLHKKYPL